MADVNLTTILIDWLDRKKYPTTSVVAHDWGRQVIGVIVGNIWCGDFDIACVYDDRVIFAGWKLADGPYPPYPVLYAADPEFFEKLDSMLEYIQSVILLASS